MTALPMQPIYRCIHGSPKGGCPYCDLAALRERLAEETARAERAEARAKALEEAAGRLLAHAVRDAGTETWTLFATYRDYESIRRLLAGKGE